MKWSNLYSTELKYNFNFKPSLFPIELVLGLFFAFSIITIFTYEERAIIAWQYTLFSGIFTLSIRFFCALLFSRKYINYSQFIEVNGFNKRVLYGTCRGAEGNNRGKEYLLSPHSRIAYWGFYLILTEPNLDEKVIQMLDGKLKFRQLRCINQESVFIDKRQLSRQEYSCLAYMINRAQQTP